VKSWTSWWLIGQRPRETGEVSVGLQVDRDAISVLVRQSTADRRADPVSDPATAGHPTDVLVELVDVPQAMGPPAQRARDDDPRIVDDLPECQREVGGRDP